MGKTPRGHIHPPRPPYRGVGHTDSTRRSWRSGASGSRAADCSCDRFQSRPEWPQTCQISRARQDLKPKHAARVCEMQTLERSVWRCSRCSNFVPPLQHVCATAAAPLCNRCSTFLATSRNSPEQMIYRAIYRVTTR